MENNFLKSSLQNAVLNIILQVLFRCITFILNAFVIRNVSGEAVGVMYVRLLLLESTILFLSREAFRKACLTKTINHNWPKVINLVWITVPLCSMLCLIFGYIWLNILVQPSTNLIGHYKLGVLAICLSCIIDMCCEPLYLITQAFLFVKVRVVADLTSMLIRSVSFALIVQYDPGKAIIAFSVAQMLSLISYAAIFYGYFTYYVYKIFPNIRDKENTTEVTTNMESNFPLHSFSDFFPKKLHNQEQIDWNLCVLIWTFLKQGIMMQILTEGERYIMTLLNVLSFSEQGIFDVVNNLGSIAARFIFRPIEESAYFYFSQMVHRDQSIRNQNKTSMEEAAIVLEYLLRSVVSLGMLVFCFGQAYSTFALFLYGGTNLSRGLGPSLLKTHCLAILLLAVNGTTEAYAQATMNRYYLNRYNKVMLAFSIGFLVANWFLSYVFGSIGFILANCCNMMARIIHSIFFIHKRYKNTSHKPLRGLIPNKMFLTTLLLSMLVTLLSEAYFIDNSPLSHLSIGIVCLLSTLAVWIYKEQHLIKYGMAICKSKQS